MNKSEKKNVIAVACIAIFILVCISWVKFSHVGRAFWNTWTASIQHVDDRTNYNTLKKVEDTCRAMISSYEADSLTYKQYKESENTEKKSWAEQAKMRANKTASTYNHYVMENSFVWKGNIPVDIQADLPYLE
ncbi:MAG: hypothetical protein K2O84_03800 [Oscillospiraceae bacterium]|nr:hypothetical protein [Oscillospiraceae bacterium]